jgi:hypothetical protein
VAELLETDVIKCHKVSLSIVICLSGGIALNSLYRFIERIFPTSDDAFSRLRAILRYGVPFGGSGVDRQHCRRRKIHGGGKTLLFEEPYGLYKGAESDGGLCQRQ